MLSKGATTCWERLEFVESGPELGMASHCHPMYATISGWFYTYLLGIRPTEPGFASFDFRPYVPKALPWVDGTLKTVKGDIAASWKQTDSGVDLEVTVPFNSVCRLLLPCAGDALVDNAKADIQCDGALRFVLLDAGKHTVKNTRV
jgi:alpha-L-rhamnosidase